MRAAAIVGCVGLVLGAAACASDAPSDSRDSADSADSADSSAPADGAQVAGDALAGRPSAVPNEFVATPAGYFHPSCINVMREDERVRADGKIESRGGAVRELAQCAYPHYDKRGRIVDDRGHVKVAPGEAHEPTINGWIEYASTVTSTPLDFVQALWQVPTAPYSAGGQTLYYFPGLEDTNDVVTIVQPVLGWTGGQWTLASWNCCVNGNVNESTPIDVSPGDLAYGYTYGTNCTSGVCANWSIYSADETTGQSTTLSTSGYGQAMNWAFGGVLEAYDITSCQQFPANGTVRDYDIYIQTTTGTNITNTAWSPTIPGGSPACGYSVSTGVQTVSVNTTGTVPSGNLAPTSPTTCGLMTAGQGITAGHALVSCDGRFNLSMQLDGNLVLYEGATVLWYSHTQHTSTFSAIMQGDGNFVAYDLTNAARFNSGTYGHAGAYLALQNDGNLVVYSSTGVALWNTGTYGH